MVVSANGIAKLAFIGGNVAASHYLGPDSNPDLVRVLVEVFSEIFPQL